MAENKNDLLAYILLGIFMYALLTKGGNLPSLGVVSISSPGATEFTLWSAWDTGAVINTNCGSRSMAVLVGQPGGLSPLTDLQWTVEIVENKNAQSKIASASLGVVDIQNVRVEVQMDSDFCTGNVKNTLGYPNAWNVIRLTGKQPVVCAQVITKACNPATNLIKEFPDSCIADGWTTNLTKCPAPTPAPTINATTIPAPTEKPKPPLLNQILSKFINWLKSLFGIPPTQTVTPIQANVPPNTQTSVSVDISVPPLDTDSSDGTKQTRYSIFGIYDSAFNLVQEGQWEEIFGNYIKTITFTTPAKTGKYAIVIAVATYSQVYDNTLQKWTTSEPVIATEGATFNVVLGEPSKPLPPIKTSFLQQIVNWFVNLFRNLFGWR